MTNIFSMNYKVHLQRSYWHRIFQDLSKTPLGNTRGSEAKTPIRSIDNYRYFSGLRQAVFCSGAPVQPVALFLPFSCIHPPTGVEEKSESLPGTWRGRLWAGSDP